jgi:hypothetical protein
VIDYDHAAVGAHDHINVIAHRITDWRQRGGVDRSHLRPMTASAGLTQGQSKARPFGWASSPPTSRAKNRSRAEGGLAFQHAMRLSADQRITRGRVRPSSQKLGLETRGVPASSLYVYLLNEHEARSVWQSIGWTFSNRAANSAIPPPCWGVAAIYTRRTMLPRELRRRFCIALTHLSRR